MACEIIVTDGAVFVLWGKPSQRDNVRILSEVREASKKAGKPVAYITRVPVDAPAPDRMTQRYLMQGIETGIKYCSSYHVILEGKGFMAAMKRALLATFFHVAQRRATFHIHEGPTCVLRAASREERLAVAAVLQEAHERGLLKAAPPVSLAPPSSRRN